MTSPLLELSLSISIVQHESSSPWEIRPLPAMEDPFQSPCWRYSGVMSILKGHPKILSSIKTKQKLLARYMCQKLWKLI